MKLIATLLLTSFFMRLAPAPQIKVAAAKTEPKVEVHLEAKSKPVEPPKPKPVQVTAPAPVVAQKAPEQPTSDAKAFIYQKESGNNPGAINPSSGACGLGQALPCSKMPCSLSDYACQDQFFTNYMLNRYGTWENARSFWEANRWW